MPGIDIPELMSIDQLAPRLGITVRHVLRLIAEKRVPHLKVGRLVRFDPARPHVARRESHPRRRTGPDRLTCAELPCERGPRPLQPLDDYRLRTRRSPRSTSLRSSPERLPARSVTSVLFKVTRAVTFTTES